MMLSPDLHRRKVPAEEKEPLPRPLHTVVSAHLPAAAPPM